MHRRRYTISRDVGNILHDISNLRSHENLPEFIRGMEPDKLRMLKQHVTYIDDATNRKASGGGRKAKVMYHGTNATAADKIKAHGFRKLTGLRAGFLGSLHSVQNQGVFMSPDKYVARFFGQDRGLHHNEHSKLITSYVKHGKTLDFDKVPAHVARVARSITKSNIRGKISSSHAVELTDHPDFISHLKKHGYTSVRMRETPSIYRSAGIRGKTPKTYLVFSPKHVAVADKGHISYPKALYAHAKKFVAVTAKRK